LGSIVGVRHESCSVRKHSKCGRPSEIYHFHNIDAEAVVEACGKVLSETALEKVIVTRHSLDEVSQSDSTHTSTAQPHWTELWPTKNQNHKH
jgi:pyruvate dehydrogenase E1 component